ncbi:MAG: hypothetical protein AVDCRST_MAG21-598 [uncultured Nocardioidaceae bacterium]|uniref:DUF11 domain-containing protein n=1 Tax=uncultured Nocardioidaceae bacterium TaxID=253824 RepID=A0A6J4MW54_9ACTN|nr:MAG: hypothetical protein AVDCRST_MAG21-598 [uncultured Nocardioidaceae bacterium]
MSRFSLPHRGRAPAAAIAVAGLLVAGLSSTSGAAAAPDRSARGPASAATPASLAPGLDGEPEPFSEEATGLADLDTRGSVEPLASQRAAVPAGATVRWNRYGTPASLSKVSGFLSGPSSAAPADAARSYLRAHAGLFGLSSAQVNDLDLVNDSELTQSEAHAVLFRQRYAGQVAAADGMVSVGVAPGGQVAYVSSSLARVGSGVTLAPATLGAVQAWKAAVTELRAKNAPTIPAAPDTSKIIAGQSGEFTTLRAPGFAQPQQVRQRALAMPDGTVRRVFEANVINSPGGEAAAYTSFVDAATGEVLLRQNRVDNFAAGQPVQAPVSPMMSEFTEPFQGAFTAAESCGPRHGFEVDGQTQTIVYQANAVNPANDITIKLYDPNNNVVSSQDTLFSPEAQTYTGPIEAGVYKVEVCAFEGADPIVTGEYIGSFTASNQEATADFNYPPKWKYFLANPVLNFSATHTADNRSIGCWETEVGGVKDPNCDNPPSDLNNLAARMPWDVDPRTDIPTFTTQGNAAITAEAWANPNTIVFGNLTPGAFGQRPFDVDREYLHEFKDVWNNQKCNPATLTPGDPTGQTVEPGNDILASVTHLFASHNRMHDFSYFLGFTEKNYNLQDSNFGNGGRPGDPEVGNVQSGALTGGPPTFGGRDNANQLTLQDGVPGITNQYLFQPIAGGFYAPCVDGDYDFGVVGHEYTHAISNRMVGGPDSGLSGFQGGSMGESWSDQVAAEYLLAHNYKPGVSPFVEGAYVTGNKDTGIRNYRLDDNPLQYGDIGYDLTGPEVHADGEPWSAVNIDIRQAMIAKYNGQFPAGNDALQRRCAQGNTFAEPPQDPTPAQRCPGNRRWVQLMFDSFLMQQPDTSMLDARDAMLAADKMRFGGANLELMWREFANNGFGADADTDTTEDVQPTPGYASPLSGEGTLKLSAVGLGGNKEVPVEGTLYVGRYEARITPIADTDPGTTLPNTVRMVPDSYEFVFQADGYGLQRAAATITAGNTTAEEIHLSRNVASKFSGASIDGASPNSVNTDNLIDDTEDTNFANTGQPGVSVDTTDPVVNVNLAGDSAREVRSVKVSAMLVPADNGAEEGEPQPEDPESGSRFTALRKFAIEVCTETTANDCSSIAPSGTPASPYQRIYTSPDDAFNGVRPRPLAPALIFKRFDIPDTAATHVRLVALENQCTGQAGFAGEQDNDPLNDTDCKTASDRDESVRAAELEVFGYDTETRPIGDPVVLMTSAGKTTAAAGERVKYTFTYTNLGPKASSNADIRIVDLPTGLNFVDASGTGDYAPKARAVRWTLGTVGVNETGSVTLTTKVAADAAPATVLLTTAQFAGSKTFSPPAAAITIVGP